MLNKIIKYSLENRLVILVISVVLLVGGSYVSTNVEVDVFPDLNAPTVVVMTEAHGMAPEEVERLVTFPIETAVNGAANLRRVRSSSAMGYSMVWVEFDWGTDIYDARQTVSEKLIEVKESLPKGAGNPFIAPQASLLGEIMIFSMTSDSISPLDLRTMGEWVIRPRLLSVGGVAQVTIMGGEYKQYQVLINPEKMKYSKVSLNEVTSALEESNDNAPGGIINQYGNEYNVRGMARTNKIEELGKIIVSDKGGHSIKIEDVAEIVIDGAPKIGEGSYLAEKAIIFTVTKQPGINTLELTEKLDEAIDDIQDKLGSKVQIHKDIFLQADFIATAVNNVRKALIEGAIFVIIILFLFLMNWRTTVISLVAIPLSLLVAILTLKWLGFTINTMSLGGMAIAIGSLVDDAIIDVENVYKRLKENARKKNENRVPALKVIYEASKEIRASIMNATIIIIIAFIPLFFLSGMEGRMLKPLGISFIVALFASLVVAVTVTPVLCSYLLTSQKRLAKNKRDGWLSRKLILWYSIALKKVMTIKKVTVAIAVVLFVVALFFFSKFGRSFLPPFNEGSLVVNIATIPGVSLDESDKIGEQTERLLLEIPEIDVTSRKTGRAEHAEHSFGTNVSEIEVPFELKDRSRSEFVKEVREKINSVSGVITSVGQPISHRMDHMLSGSKTSIAIKLFGTDLEKMYDIAQKIKRNIQSIEGVVDLVVEQQVEVPQIHITPKRDMLFKYQIPIKEFITFIEYGFGGERVADVFEEEKSFDLVVRFNEESRNNIETIGKTLIDAGVGGKIPLNYVANISSATGLNTISRENVQRKLVISANVAERDIRSVVNEIKNTVDAKVKMPENYRVEYGGQFESEERASKILLYTSLLAILLIFVILHQEFKNTVIAGIILLNLPLALIGGVLAITFSSNVLSIPAIIGFITLFGIATRNGILLVSHYQNLLKEGYNLYDSIIKGSLDRLNPILMTALTAALALIPLAFAGDKPGNEIQSPMAIVILGGLLSSTILNLFIVPVIFYLMHKKQIIKQ